MFIKHLQLKNYRNYEALDIEFDDQINIFYGNNAQGKTNILESIYMLALAKSHRSSNEKELVQWGQSFSVIKGNIVKRMGDLTLDLQISNKGKKVKVNNLEKRKLSEYVGILNVIMFGPEDLNLVKGSPANRRRFLDIEIGQISPSYIYNLSQYQKIIQQRNNLLKDFTVENKNKLELLEIWDTQLVEYGAKLIEKRISFIKLLEKWANIIHANITTNKENLTIHYNPSVNLEGKNHLDDLKEQFSTQLKNVTSQELRRGSTLIGPHRDDISFYINNIDAQIYGSQGQQRTTALSIKMAEIDLIYHEIGEYPILLLDDVLSELDHERQTHLIKAIENKVQTMITTTSIEGIDFNRLQKSTLFYVEKGMVRRKE